MTAVEYMELCNIFIQFGKIKDINFEDELFNTSFSDEKIVRGIDFKEGYLTLGEWVPSGCVCCGSWIEEETINLDQLAQRGYLIELIDMMDQVLKNKTGI